MPKISAKTASIPGSVLHGGAVTTPTAATRRPSITDPSMTDPMPELYRPAPWLLAVAATFKRAYAVAVAQLQENPVVDWTDCPLVEVIPGKVSGVPLLKGTRLPANTVLSNYEAGSPVDEIADNFDMPEKTIRDILTYAANKQKQPQP